MSDDPACVNCGHLLSRHYYGIEPCVGFNGTLDAPECGCRDFSDRIDWEKRCKQKEAQLSELLEKAAGEAVAEALRDYRSMIAPGEPAERVAHMHVGSFIDGWKACARRCERRIRALKTSADSLRVGTGKPCPHCGRAHDGAVTMECIREPAHPHLVDGEFQSDKYPTCPRGKVPLSTKDATAQDLLWMYAQRRRVVDAQFADDLEIALRAKGFVPREELEKKDEDRCVCGHRRDFHYGCFALNRANGCMAHASCDCRLFRKAPASESETP